MNNIYRNNDNNLFFFLIYEIFFFSRRLLKYFFQNIERPYVCFNHVYIHILNKYSYKNQEYIHK